MPAAACMFRPGILQPVHGARSRTSWYRLFYAFAKPVLPLPGSAFHNQVLTTEEIGRAVLTVARRGAPKPVQESRNVRAVLVP
jgi:hypothetical protein